MKEKVLNTEEVIMSNRYEECVHGLARDGYAYIDIDSDQVDAVRDGFKGFIERRNVLGDDTRWALQRPGEDEIDRGLWAREGNGKDIKSVFHFDRDLVTDLCVQNRVMYTEDISYFRATAKLYKELCVQAGRVLQAFDGLHETRMYTPFLLSRNQQPYATTTLRSLWYPPVVGQKGAKPHIDRGLLTIHLGDEGGHLLALTNKDDSNGEPVSPVRGKALVFWGVKVLWATDGKFRPLWHSSVTDPGQERFALVQFNHIAIPGYEVRDATKSCADWDARHIAK